MKLLSSVLIALLVAVSGRGATPDEVTAWKREFPVVSVEAPFAVRMMVSQYEVSVSQATAANLYPLIRNLRERAEKDLADATQTARGGKGPSAKDAREKRAWLNDRFLPFLRKMG